MVWINLVVGAVSTALGVYRVYQHAPTVYPVGVLLVVVGIFNLMVGAYRVGRIT